MEWLDSGARFSRAGGARGSAERLSQVLTWWAWPSGCWEASQGVRDARGGLEGTRRGRESV